MKDDFTSVIKALEYLETNYKDTDFGECLMSIFAYQGKGLNDPMLMDIKIKEGDIPNENDPWLLEVNFSFTFDSKEKNKGYNLYKKLNDLFISQIEIPIFKGVYEEFFNEGDEKTNVLKANFYDISIKQLLSVISLSLNALYPILDKSNPWVFLQMEDEDGGFIPENEFYA